MFYILLNQHVFFKYIVFHYWQNVFAARVSFRRPFVPNSFFASVLPTNGLGRSAQTDLIPARAKP